MRAPRPTDRAALSDLRRLLDAVWPDGWQDEWGPRPRPEDLRKLLGYSHPLCEPAEYRGMTGIGSGGVPVRGLTQFGITLMTLDGKHHQFTLTDINLRRLADDIVLRIPGWFGAVVQDAIDKNVGAGHLAWTDGHQRSNQSQSDASFGSRSSADLDCTGSTLSPAASNASRAP